MTHIEKEKATIDKMILLYCKHVHASATLCKNCEELRNYAHLRLDKCRYGNHKPTCDSCKTHCYAPQMRAQITEVMRYAGPRMIFYHPLAAISHLFRKFFYKP